MVVPNYNELPPFGALLKAFRKHRRLTQQQLAEGIGVHRHAIVRWELGENLPASKGIVLELARHLHLDDQETRQLLEASLTALSPYFLVPLPRNPFFTGREEILEALHTHLDTDQVVALTQMHALHGLGGIGKTQIALEYAYRYALEYSAVFWIGAETVENILSSLRLIAEVLQLPGRDDRDQQQVVAAVQHWLTTHSQWLLIWDNVEDLAMLDRFLPSARQGSILITTRCQALGTLARGIDLLPMGHEEGMLFLLRRAKVLEQEGGSEQMQQFAVSMQSEYAAASELVTAMGGLPLALDQAGAYIDETVCGLAGYLRRYEQQRYQLLDRRGAASGDHPRSVVATLWLGCQRVAQQHTAALELLRFCAFVSPDAIPEELLQVDVSHLGPMLGPVAADPCQLDQTIAVLRSLSLIQRHPETETLSLHRLVQVILREGMSEQERAVWQQRVTHTLNTLFPDVSSESTTNVWRQCERLLPHVLAGVVTLTNRAGDQERVRVLGKAADYLRERVQYEQAQPLYERALHLGEQVLGSIHPDMAYPLSGLATLYQEQGKFELAEPLYGRAMHIWEQALGPEHPLVAHPLNGLAILYEKQGKSEQAEPLFHRALRIWEQALGPEHPLVARPLNGLAIHYRRQGKFELAEPLYERALHIREQALGPEHPQMVQLLYNLAHLYQKQGKYEQAEPLFRQSLRIEEQVRDPEHPDLAYPLIGLADLYQKQGKDKQAEPLLQRALHLCERAWGPEHLLVSYPLYNLAILYLGQGKYEQAESFSQRALSIAEQAWGPEHPDVALSLNGLADLYAEQGKYEQAEPLYQRALCIWEQALGLEHPDLASSLNGHANLYLGQGKYEQAEPLYQRALRIREQHLGQHHPETAQTLHDLANFRKKQGNLSEAISFAERALEIRSQSLGDTHLQTVATRALYAQLIHEQGCGEEEESSEPKTQERLPLHTMSVAVRGATEQVAYTRTVRMREVTFTCTICGQTVTQQHYPSGRIKYCSDACRAVRAAQMQEARVAAQREKRRTAREAHLRARQQDVL